MALTLAQMESRVATLLFDPSNTIWTTAVLDAGLRLALHDYSLANPQSAETFITLPGAGREIALEGITGLLQVTDVWWPYYSTGEETWPPNRVRGFRLWWDDARPVLFLTVEEDSQPATDDEVRIWYTKLHTIQNLDSASVTSYPDDHESIIIKGAAGYALLARSTDLNETVVNMSISTPNYGTLAEVYLTTFRADLEYLRRGANVRGEPWGAGWQMDRWDQQGYEQPYWIAGRY